VSDFDRHWLFSKGDFSSGPMPNFDDSSWRKLNLPHDWSIEGPFGPEYASGTGYAPGGIGWYRKHFRLDPALKGKAAAVEFDGVYDHSEVWLNGQFVGGRPYGYSSFECELTPLLKFGAQENVIAVRVDHSRFADSRWYTGSGIFRHVRLRFTDELHVAHWGTYVTTPEVNPDAATIQVETTVENASTNDEPFSLESQILTPDGRAVASLSTSGSISSYTNQLVVQRFTLPHPQLWTLESPKLYSVRNRLSANSNLVDEVTTPFGIRSIRFDADQGFFLNGVSMKLKGVCIHHEAGGLGAAVPEKVLERRLRVLKEIGANAIRTSHNPPAPELLTLCDQLGLLVKDEAFDEYTPAKNKWVSGRNHGLPARFGYAEDFEQWATTDISDMVRRDRNHPCVILWSIGNELDYANDPFSHPVLGREYHPGNPPAQDLAKHARPLIAAVKSLDTTRPVTAALATVAMSDAVGFASMLDAVGYNYQETRYAADHAKFPKRIIFGSENFHMLSNWAAVRDNPYVAGQFLWTGIDYLGEAGPWPNRGSQAGLLDICGFKKPLAWFRQSLWTEQPMAYICVAPRGEGGGQRGRLRAEESWNWSSNSTVTVRCYTTCPEVQLSLNGKPIGTRRFADAVQGALTWNVPFEPGTLEAVGLRDGKSICSYKLKTAGPAARVELLPDATQIAADGRDICHVEFQIVDAQGVRVPDAQNEVSFALTGPAEILTIENADLNSPESYKSSTHKAFHGRGLAILQSSVAAGTVEFTATSEGLRSSTIAIQSR
jgi:beta-galactosidase